MKLTKEMIEKIEKIVEEMDLTWEYEAVGIRFQEMPFELGEIDHISHAWVDNEDTGIELDGLSTIDYKDIRKFASNPFKYGEYYGDHVAIICGNSAGTGDDYFEQLISNPICKAIIC